MPSIDSLASAVAGACAASVMTLYFAKKYLESIETAIAKIEEIQQKLTEITVKMEMKEEDSNLLQLHDKKLAVLENEIYGKHKRK